MFWFGLGWVLFVHLGFFWAGMLLLIYKRSFVTQVLRLEKLRHPKKCPMSHSVLERQAVVKCTCGSPGSSGHGTIQPSRDVSLSHSAWLWHVFTNAISHVSAPEKMFIIL